MSLEIRRRLPPATRWPVMLLGSLGVAGLSFLVLPHSVAYDPYSWLIWGREITHLDLDTRQAATAVKPLAIVFTTLFGRTGSAAPVLWLLVARTATVVSLVLAFRLAHRYAGVWAGLVAAVCLANTDEYLGYLFMQGMSEPMATATVLAAVDSHLDGNRRAALGWLVAAGLLRPEAWPFLFVYALWLAWPRSWRRRIAAAVLGCGVPFSWFVIDLFGAHELFRSANAATHQSQGGPLLSREPGLATLRETWHLVSPPTEILFLLAVVGALYVWRRAGLAPPTVWFAAGAFLWLIVDAALAQGHFATGAPRYLLPGAGLACVVVGIFAVDVARWLGQRLPTPQPAMVAAIVVALAVAGAVTPRSLNTGHQIRVGALEGRRLGRLASGFERAEAEAGGRAAILRCGTVDTGNLEVPLVAWRLDTHIDQIEVGTSMPGTVFQQGNSPAVAASVVPRYTRLRVIGSTDHSWTVFTTCPPR